MKGVSVVGFPLYTLSRYRGMGSSPGALRKAGLLSALGEGILDYGDVQIQPLNNDAAEGGVKNMSHFKRASDKIFERAAAIDSSELLICLGGECSTTVGALAGLKQHLNGTLGMLWIDSHGDFNTPETSPSGYIGGMCLAMACGRGPKLSDSIERARPLLEEERVVHMGSRALDQRESELMRASAMGMITMEDIGREGIRSVASWSARRLADSADWIICHLDVDALDQAVMPAVNYPTSGGMTADQVVKAIEALKAIGKLGVLEVSAYNPDLDKSGRSAEVVVGLVRESLHQ